MCGKGPLRAIGAAAGLLLAGLAMAEAVPTEEVAKCKAAYQQKLTEFTQETEAAKADLLSRYRKAIDNLRLTARQNGDLDAIQAVDEEIKRLEKQKILPPAPSNPDLAKAVRLCREAQDKVSLENARKVMDYTEKYALFLEARKKEAVRGDKLELAKAFDAEEKAARQTPEYQEAAFLIAEKPAPEAVPAEVAPDAPVPVAPEASGKAAPPAAAADLPPLAAPRIGKDGEKIQPRVDPDGLYDAQRILEGSPAAQLGAPSAYKTLTATETAKLPLSGGSVGIAMEGALDSENARYQLRFKLRNKSTGANLTNLKVLVQYFAKTPNNVAAQESRMQVTLIPQLGAKNITCEMKPADLAFAYTYHYRGASTTEEREGAFLGVIVSVFSPDDKLLGQVTSANTLKDRGRSAFEVPAFWLERDDGAPMNQPAGIPPRRFRQPINGN